jgi:protein-L-isoaspartate O-methyltransferase
VTAHFTATWALPREDFEEALPNTDVYVDQKIPAEGSEEMEEYMVEEKHIRDVINS